MLGMTKGTLHSAGGHQLPQSHRPPTALPSRGHCYGQCLTMQIAGLPILSQSQTTNMEGRLCKEQNSGNHRRARRMHLRYSSYQPISDQCRHPSASPPNSQYLESEVPGVHGYNAKANAPGGPAGPERNPKTQHYRLPTVAVSTSVHPDVHGVQCQSQCTGWTSKAGKKPKAATR